MLDKLLYQPEDHSWPKGFYDGEKTDAQTEDEVRQYDGPVDISQVHGSALDLGSVTPLPTRICPRE
jgi:hypothetical protein